VTKMAVTGKRLALLLAVGLVVAACGTAVRAPVTPVVVTLGDSVPAGTACGCDPFPRLYAQAQHAADVNLAVPGSTAADVLAALPANRGVLAGAAEVLLMTGANDVDDVGDPGPAADAVRVNTALRKAAANGNATYVPTLEAFHGDDGTRDPTGLLAPDGDHPNAAGHAAIAALIPPLR
jgi:acyl-CoA thioesterase I